MSKRHSLRRAAILAAALAGVPASVRAESSLPVQLRLYGFLNGEVERAWASGGATPYAARQRVTDGNSRLGGIVTYDVAPRTKAIAQLEGALNFDQGGVSDQASSALITSRNSFVGVEHELAGRLVVGHVDSTYRGLVGSGGALGGNLGLTTTGLDLWNNTSAQVTGNFYSPFSRGEARYKNSVNYVSPDWTVVPEWVSVRIGASWSADERLSSNGYQRDRYSAGARVAVKGVEIGAGFDRQENSGVDADQLAQGFGFGVGGVPNRATTFSKVLAGYHFGSGTYVGAGYERASYGYTLTVPPTTTNPYASVKTGTMHQDGWMASLAQTVGPVALMASVAELKVLEGAVVGADRDYRGSQYSLGARWTITDVFAVYAYYTEIKNHARQNLDLGQAPLYGNELGTPKASLSPGSSPSAFGLGAIVRF
jgi:uncharacterized protein (DUF736 family)